MNIGKVMAFGMIAALASFGVACGGGEVPEAKAPETPAAPEATPPETPEVPAAGGDEKKEEPAAEPKEEEKK